MSEISRDDVVAVFGRIDDSTIAQIIATGASVDELKAAKQWVARGADSTIGNPSMGPGAIGRVIEIIETANDSSLGNSGSTLA